MTGTITTPEPGAGAAHSRAAVTELVRRGYDAPALRDKAAALRDTLRAGGLEVHYQPIVSLPDRRVLGFEALARLRIPNGDLIPPDRFIGLAESCGLIVPLGLEVLATAASALSAWRQRPALAGAYVSVNVSPVQLVQPLFTDWVREVLRAHMLPASALVLEVTESDFAGPDAAEALNVVAATGVRLALDDFGTGFATLESVKRLPVQIIKLDRGFVAGITEEGFDSAIVRNVLALAYDLDLSVVAEGVETEVQAATLAAWGCDAAQGWLFGRPAAADRVAAPNPSAEAAPIPRTSWGPVTRTDTLAVARVLALTNPEGDEHRAVVHALATGIAEAMRLPDATVRDVGMLALCHDAERLRPLLRGRLRSANGANPLRAMIDGGASAGDGPFAAQLVALADHVARGTWTEQASLRPKLLADGLVAAAVGQPSVVAGAMRHLAETVSLGPTPALHELLDIHPEPQLWAQSTEDRLRPLLSLARALGPGADPRDLVGHLADEACAALCAASLSISRWDRDAGVLRVVVNVGRLGDGEERYPDDELYPLAEYPSASRMFATGMPNITRADDADDCSAERALLERLGKGSSAAVPIHIEDRLWGELYATTDVGQPAFGPRDVEVLMSVAGVVGGALTRGEYLERVARLAFEDPLTGLANRRAVDDRLTEVLDHTDDPVSLVVLDLNGLKQINDEYGHAAGDRVLCAVADALRVAALELPYAMTARLGGDEFCVVVAGDDGEAAQQLVARAAERLSAAPPPQVTIAAGVATSGRAGRTARDLFAAADRTQYRAKQSGLLMLVDSAVPLVAGAPSADRRAAHRTAGDVVATGQASAVDVACGRVVEALGVLGDAALPDVLAAVAEPIAQAADLGRWGLSHVGDDGLLRVVRLHLRRTRPTPQPGDLISPEDESWPLADYPITIAAIDDSRPFWVHVDRDDHDEMERTVLREIGMVSVIGLGARDASGGWLLELYADQFSDDLEGFFPLARLIARSLRAA